MRQVLGNSSRRYSITSSDLRSANIELFSPVFQRLVFLTVKNFIHLSWNNFPWSNLCPLLIALPLHILVKTMHFLNSPFRYGVPALNPTVSLLSRLFEQAQLIQPWCRWPSAWSSPFFFMQWLAYYIDIHTVLFMHLYWNLRTCEKQGLLKFLPLSNLQLGLLPFFFKGAFKIFTRFCI